MKKKKAKNGPGRPPVYPYSSLCIREVNVSVFNTESTRLNARCAAHMVAKRHGKKFDTINSVSKSGKFVLEVTRIK